jgi:multisubunit Na+/H+ antiporter MnhB subunit
MDHATPPAINGTYRSALKSSRFRKDSADKLPLMARGRLHSSSTRVLSIVMILIGIALIARTLFAGGGALATGIVLGVLFVFAGLARLYLQLRG